jgi:hypothetical protein
MQREVEVAATSVEGVLLGLVGLALVGIIPW